MKDKVINDLLKRISDLEFEVEKQDKEIERLKEDIESRKKEIDFWRIQFSNKEEIINKAIEYMNDTIDFSWKDNSPIKNGKSLSLNKLLDILKGVDKE